MVRARQMCDGRTVVTTGANSGIGLATAPKLARRGFRSVGTARSEEKAWRARVLSSRAGQFLGAFVSRRAVERGYREQFADPTRISPTQMDAVWNTFADRKSRHCLWQQAHQLDFGDIEPMLGRISAPVLLLWEGTIKRRRSRGLAAWSVTLSTLASPSSNTAVITHPSSSPPASPRSRASSLPRPGCRNIDARKRRRVSAAC